jgi:RNA polymerase-interacting CarD/CdnL/TRCF family regulator
MNMGIIVVHDVRDHNLNGMKKQGLRFYVEQSRNEVRLPTIKTSYQGIGRGINLADFTQVLEYEVPMPFHLAHLLSLPNLLARKIRGI